MGQGMFRLFLVLISLGLAIAGVFISCSKPATELMNGLAVATFFGGCAAVFLVELVENWKLKRRISLAGDVAIIGGLRITTRNWRNLGLFLALTVLGAFWAGFTTFNPVFNIVSAFVAAVGVLGLVLMSLRANEQYLEFQPQGIVVGSRGSSALLAWDNIATLRIVRMHGNKFIGITVASPQAWFDSLRPDSVVGRKRLERNLSVAWSFYGCHVVIMPWIYNLDLGFLFLTLEKHSTRPETRSELLPKAQLPSK